MKNIIFLALSLFIFTSCSSTYYKIEDMLNPVDGTDFTLMSNKLAIDICPKITSFHKKYNLFITDFVNISNLKNKSELGFLLSSQLKVAALENCNRDLDIKELTLGKDLKLGQNGSNILSRSVSELKSTTISKKGKILVGTYAITTRKLIIYLKVIDLETGAIQYSKSTSTNLSEEILHLEGIDNRPVIYQPLVL